MPVFIRYSLKASCVTVALIPTAIALLFAGILIGKPKPCEGRAPCKTTPFSVEVLLLPAFTFVPVVATALFFALSKRDAATPHPERIYTVSAEQVPSVELDLNDKSRVSGSENLEFGIAERDK
jgi:hypothetical protein